MKTVYQFLAVCVLGGLVSPVGAISIDAFTSTQRVSVGGPPAGPRSAFGSLLASDAIGGERDIFVERTSSNSGSVAVDVAGSASGVASYNSGILTTGSGLIVWDGIDGDANINTGGLGGIDLTEGGAHSLFRIDQTSDLGGFLTLTVYQDATHISRAIIPVLADPSFTFDSVDVPFSDFNAIGSAGGADFSQVGAVSLFLDGSTAAADIGVRGLTTIAVPETSGSFTLALLTLSLFAFWTKARRV